MTADISVYKRQGGADVEEKRFIFKKCKNYFLGIKVRM